VTRRRSSERTIPADDADRRRGADVALSLPRESQADDDDDRWPIGREGVLGVEAMDPPRAIQRNPPRQETDKGAIGVAQSQGEELTRFCSVVW
jgi:hypothetical protein